MDKENYTQYHDCIRTKRIKGNAAIMESHNGTDFASNMLRLAIELRNRNKEVAIVYTEDSKNRIECVAAKYGLSDCQFIERESATYFEILATAKYYFTDVAFHPLFFKRIGQICVTTWHGTPLKVLGYSFMKDEYVVANQKRGFLLADYLVMPNEYTWECIRKSYQLDNLFRGKVLFEGYPRNDIFFNSEIRRQDLINELGLTGKRIIVYMPTWRGKVVAVDNGQTDELQTYLREWDSKLEENTIVIAKLHRLNAAQLNFSSFKQIIPFPEEYETYDILNCADVLVTDYSSVMFDFELTRKKIVLFCYDKEDYMRNRVCYFNINELPFTIVENVSNLVEETSNNSCNEYSQVINKFNKNDNEFSSKNIVRMILENDKENNKSEETKSNVLVFCGDLSPGKETDSLFFELDKFSMGSNEQICVSYLNHLFIEKWHRLLQLKQFNNMPFYMYQKSYFHSLLKEQNLSQSLSGEIMRGKVDKVKLRKLDLMYKREGYRFLYNCRIKKYIRYAGLDIDSLKFLVVFEGYKVLYVHETMVAKALADAIFNFYLLRAASYSNEIIFPNENVYTKYKANISKVKTGAIKIQQLY